MTDIIHHILDSPVPVVVYVSPDGARGASAGFLILLSADIAAMAPGTRTGAATPILMPGWVPCRWTRVCAKKSITMPPRFYAALPTNAGETPKFAETAITEARAFSGQEALDGHLIDLFASDKQELLGELNGREITRFNGKKETLSLQNYRIVDFQLSARERFLARIVEPDVFFLLLLVARSDSTQNSRTPVLLPLVCGRYLHVVWRCTRCRSSPVNIAGVLLILLGLALFIMEAKFTSMVCCCWVGSCPCCLVRCF